MGYTYNVDWDDEELYYEIRDIASCYEGDKEQALEEINAKIKEHITAKFNVPVTIEVHADGKIIYNGNHCCNVSITVPAENKAQAHEIFSWHYNGEGYKESLKSCEDIEEYLVNEG